MFGVGPFVACAVMGHVGDISRFDSRAAFAAYNGTAPIEVSSGEKKIYRLSRRGNRRLNHAIHMAAITQIHFVTVPAGTTTNANGPRARPAKKPSGSSNGGSAI